MGRFILQSKQNAYTIKVSLNLEREKTEYSSE